MNSRVVVVVCVVFAASGWAPAASAQPPQTLGFTFTPASGSPGTRVDFEGDVPIDAPDFDTYQMSDFAYGLSALDVPTNPDTCDLIVGIDNVTKTVTAQGHVSGSFTIGQQGGCFMSASGLDPQPARPGVYAVLLSCHACTPAGTLTITSPGLARTGRSTASLTATGAGLTAIGALLLALGRRRGTSAMSAR